MRASSDVESRILDATLRLMMLYGPAKVAMVDVCREAEVSRATLYRVFASRDELVDALGPHIVERYRARLGHAVEKEPRPDRRFRVVVRTVYTFVRGGAAEPMQVRENQSDFVLAQFRGSWSELVGPIREAILPAFPPGTTRRHHAVGVAAELIAQTAFAQRMGPALLDEDALVEVLVAYAASIA